MKLPTTFDIREHPTREHIICCGGLYANVHAFNAFLSRCDAAGTARTDVYCLGDLSGFGPHPERTLAAVAGSGLHVLQGNHDHALAHGFGGCACGYREGGGDAHFSQLSFDYTQPRVSAESRAWMAGLPHQVNLSLADGRRVRLCHGSPRVMNEFLFESLPDRELRQRVAEAGVDIVVCTHTGLPWAREVGPGQWVVNCGVLGRPANDGRPNVWFAEVSAGADPQLVPLEYNWRAQAAEMAAEGLPAEFITSVREGWWACCFEILPPAEKRRGKFSARALPPSTAFRPTDQVLTSF